MKRDEFYDECIKSKLSISHLTDKSSHSQSHLAKPVGEVAQNTNTHSSTHIHTLPSFLLISSPSPFSPANSTSPYKISPFPSLLLSELLSFSFRYFTFDLLILESPASSTPSHLYLSPIHLSLSRFVPITSFCLHFQYTYPLFPLMICISLFKILNTVFLGRPFFNFGLCNSDFTNLVSIH